ncbi:MAG TPA: alpha/beta hydrolase, partial [Steroidobacteraceae bacterium]|nr:alpha/beta hydrolase [Steroidobacteraceae bacterium]
AVADGVSLYVRTVGSAGPVVVAQFATLHGTQLDRLGRSARLVLFDPRGRGRSDAVTPEQVSLDHLLRDVGVVQDWTGASQIVVVGWSGAGMETFVYAARNPGRVSRLVQLAPIGPRAKPYGEMMMQNRGRRTDQAANADFEARYKRGEYRDRGQMLCRDLFAIDTPPTLAHPATMERLPDVCAWKNEWPDSTGPYFNALLSSFGNFDWRADFPKVVIPRLVIHGDQDNIPLDASREWVAGQPNARLLIVPGSGHWPHYEQPDLVIGAIEEFVAGGWPPKAETIAAPAGGAGD